MSAILLFGVSTVALTAPAAAQSQAEKVMAIFGEASYDFGVNLQAAEGFRLGGVNDPLNLPLCEGGPTGAVAQTFGNRPSYEDETLWNYEAGVK